MRRNFESVAKINKRRMNPVVWEAPRARFPEKTSNLSF